MELLNLHYKNHSKISLNLKDLLQSGNYEKTIVNLMNESKLVFNGKYRHMEEQPHGQCDFIEEGTGKKFDAKIPISKKQGQMIMSRKGDVSALSREMYADAAECQECVIGKKKVSQLRIYKRMEELIKKLQTDENIIFFIPYTIVFDFENFPLLGAKDLLSEIYREFQENMVLNGKEMYAIYISFDKKVVLRNLVTDQREYINCPELMKYVYYDINHIEESEIGTW